MTTSLNRKRPLASLLAAAAATVAAFAAAPAATADTPDCRQSGGVRACTKDGHSSMRVEPTPRQGFGGLFSPSHIPGFGSGLPAPSILG